MFEGYQKRFHERKNVRLVNFRMLPFLNRVFRCSTFNLFEESSLEFLTSKLNVEIVIDFRNESEFDSYLLNRLFEKYELNYEQLGIHGYEGELKELKYPSSSDYSLYYLRILQHGIESFAKFLKILSISKEKSVVICCHMGKDRTGLAVYLLMSLLNYSESEIQREFLLSNVHLEKDICCFRGSWEKRNMNEKSYLKRILVQPNTLNLLSEKIEIEFGGVRKYISECLMVNPEEFLNIQRYFKRK